MITNKIIRKIWILLVGITAIIILAPMVSAEYCYWPDRWDYVCFPDCGSISGCCDSLGCYFDSEDGYSCRYDFSYGCSCEPTVHYSDYSNFGCCPFNETSGLGGVCSSSRINYNNPEDSCCYKELSKTQTCCAIDEAPITAGFFELPERTWVNTCQCCKDPYSMGDFIHYEDIDGNCVEQRVDYLGNLDPDGYGRTECVQCTSTGIYSSVSHGCKEQGKTSCCGNRLCYNPDEEICCSGSNQCAQATCDAEERCCDIDGDGFANDECCGGDTPYCEIEREWNGTDCNLINGVKEYYYKHICSECDSPNQATADQQCKNKLASDGNCDSTEPEGHDCKSQACCKKEGVNKCYDARETSCCAPDEHELDHCPDAERRECRVLGDMCCGDPCEKKDPENPWSFCDDATKTDRELWPGTYAKEPNYDVTTDKNSLVSGSDIWRRVFFDADAYTGGELGSLSSATSKFEILACNGEGCSTNWLKYTKPDGSYCRLKISNLAGSFTPVDEGDIELGASLFCRKKADGPFWPYWDTEVSGSQQKITTTRIDTTTYKKLIGYKFPVSQLYNSRPRPPPAPKPIYIEVEDHTGNEEQYTAYLGEISTGPTWLIGQKEGVSTYFGLRGNFWGTWCPKGTDYGVRPGCILDFFVNKKDGMSDSLQLKFEGPGFNSVGSTCGDEFWVGLVWEHKF